jgi:hypothetical protein
MRNESLLAILIILAGPRFPSSLALCQETTKPAWRLDVHEITLTQIDNDGMTATLALTVTANRNATLRDVVFDQVTVGGAPVHVPPLRAPIRLQQGRVADGLANIAGRVNFRDVTSLNPLRDLVRTGKASVHATIRAELELNIFQMLTLRTTRAWAVTDVSAQVKVNVPGGPLGQAAAFAVLTAADSVWTRGLSAHERSRNQTDFAKHAAEELAGSLVLLQTNYEFRSQAGESTTTRSSSVGFLIGDGRILTVSEAIEPWRFSPSLAEALGSGIARLKPSHEEISASLLLNPTTGAVEAVSSREGGLRIVKVLRQTETAISPETERTYSMRLRATDNNAAVLRADAWKQVMQGLNLASASPQEGWRPAAVYRIRSDSNGARAVLWMTEARKEDGRYILKDPLDATAFGSPVWIGNGVAGMVQTEDTAANIDTILKKLR